jgi:hypothetical protein
VQQFAVAERGDAISQGAASLVEFRQRRGTR